MESDLRSEELVAALDLGSNSFHMIVGRLRDGQLHIVDKVRERVRLGAALDERQCLRPEGEARALETLARFSERLRGMPAGRIRAVGTNTLRRAKNGPEFLARAREALGHSIEVVSGREEARLIYLGVQQSLPADGARRLVVDIGGGSTECVIGERESILEADSLFMGCVSYSLRFFGGGRITERAFGAAEVAAGLELQSIMGPYRARGWQVAVGCSGTIHAVKKIARAQGWSTGDLTADVLRRLREALLEAETLDNLQLEGLTEDRRPVLPGGVAILTALFAHLRVARMVPSGGAMREGVLYDLVGRIQHEDVRDRTIRWFCRQHAVDMAQAARVRRCALQLAVRAAPGWGLDLELADRLLSWASSLHELGLSISHTGYHRHGAYIVQNADMAGFSRDDQTMLATVIRSHRRRLKRSFFAEVPKETKKEVLRLAVLFRLAVALSRARTEDPPEIEVEANRRRLTLRFPPGWLSARPLTRADLEAHVAHLENVKVELSFEEADEAATETAFRRTS